VPPDSRSPVEPGWSQEFEWCKGQVAYNPKHKNGNTDCNSLPGLKSEASRHYSRERKLEKPKTAPHRLERYPGQNKDEHRVALQCQKNSTVEQMMNRSRASAAWTMQAGGQKEHTLWKKRLPFTRRIHMRKHITENGKNDDCDAEPTSSQRSLSSQLVQIHPVFALLPASHARPTITNNMTYDNIPNKMLRFP
jgi:hypothetical protein